MAREITTMRDSNGNDIPLKYVSKYDKAKDKTVRRILARFLKARAMLEGVVAETIAELDALAQTKESVGGEGQLQRPELRRARAGVDPAAVQRVPRGCMTRK